MYFVPTVESSHISSIQSEEEEKQNSYIMIMNNINKNNIYGSDITTNKPTTQGIQAHNNPGMLHNSN